MNFTGTWTIVESPDFDDEYLRMEAAPYVTLRQSGDRVRGEYHIGLRSGIWTVGYKRIAKSPSASSGWTR